MNQKGQIIKDTFWFTFARYMSQGIGFFTAIALRKFLGPFYMGIWSLFKVLLGYFSYLFLGVDYGASNKIPFYAGQGNKDAESEIKTTTLTVMMLASLFTSVCLLASAIVLRGRYEVEVIVGLCVLSVFVILNNFCSFYHIVLRAKHNFSLLSKSIVLESIVNLTLTLFLVRSFRIYGLYLVLVIVTLVNIGFMHFLGRYRFSFSLRFNRLVELIKVGLPLMLVGVFTWFLTSLDRIMIGSMLGVTFVGYYSIANMAQGYIGQISGFGTIIYPRMMEAYGKSGNIENIRKYVIIPPTIIAYLLPSVLGVVFFAVPLIVLSVLPDFELGIMAMQILLLQMFFSACSVQATYFLVAVGKQTRFFPIIITAIVINALGNYIFIKRGYGIYGVAVATSFVEVLRFVVFQSYSMKHFARPREIFIFLLKMVFPIMYTTFVVLIINRFVHVVGSLQEVFFRILVLFLFSIPLYIYVNSATGIISHFFIIVRSKYEKLAGKS